MSPEEAESKICEDFEETLKRLDEDHKEKIRRIERYYRFYMILTILIGVAALVLIPIFIKLWRG